MSTAISSKVLSFADARRAVEEYASHVLPTEPEMVALLDSVGMVLAEDLRADRDFPPFARATRDGYAVRWADVQRVPAQLRRIGEIRAGASTEQSSVEVNAGEAVEIMTGAPVPQGADAVVMVEYTTPLGEAVSITRGVAAGENLVPAGSEARQRDVMVERGTRVNHTVVAVGAAVGRPEVAVYRRPTVAILATGDELVDINFAPGPNQIHNSNSYSLAAQVSEAGGEPKILPVAPDHLEELELLIRKGLEYNLLLLAGGVSVGKYDLVEQALEKLRAEFFFTGVLIQPGKPLVFGDVKTGDGKTPFFGLPGNPVSTMATFELFVRPLLDGLAGAKPRALPFARAALRAEIQTRTGLTRFLPAKLGGALEQPEVEVVHWHGSGDLMAASHANCYIVVPPDREKFEAGESITVLPW